MPYNPTPTVGDSSGTTNFNPDLNELIEEAFERCGKELRTGYDFRTARRSLNFLTIEWANKGINMWTIEQGVIDLVQGQNTYWLPSDTIDLLEHQIRTNANQQNNQTDITISRISVSTYATIPNKLSQSRPIQVWVQRMSAQTNPSSAGDTLSANISATTTTIPLSNTSDLASAGYIQLNSEVIYYQYIDNNVLYNCVRGQNNTTAAAHTSGTNVFITQLPAITVWPTPDGSTPYQFIYWRLRRVQDAGSGVNVGDIPFRFIPALVSGLAYQLSTKLEGVDPQRIMGLKAAYDEAFQLAADEDREKAPIRFIPRQMFIGNY
jgi:hypothetical protein